jgi:hypothetical protein
MRRRVLKAFAQTVRSQSKSDVRYGVEIRVIRWPYLFDGIWRRISGENRVPPPAPSIFKKSMWLEEQHVIGFGVRLEFSVARFIEAG